MDLRQANAPVMLFVGEGEIATPPRLPSSTRGRVLGRRLITKPFTFETIGLTARDAIDR